MIHPLFEPSNMSVDEIWNKIEQMSHRVNLAKINNMEYNIIDSMNSVIAMCYMELERRQASRDYDILKDEPCAFDSDSYLSDENGDVQHGMGKREPLYKPGW